MVQVNARRHRPTPRTRQTKRVQHPRVTIAPATVGAGVRERNSKCNVSINLAWYCTTGSFGGVQHSMVCSSRWLIAV